MKSVLFVMSFSGTMVLIFQVIVNLFFKNIVLAKFNYILLKLSIIYYLLPICFIKNYYLLFLENIGCKNLSIRKKQTYDIDIIKGLKIKDVNFSDTYTMLIMILFFLYLIIILMFIYHIITYNILKFRIFKYSLKIEDKKIISILENEKKNLSINKKIFIRVSTHIHTPMTTGFFQPIVLLPSKKISEKELTYIIRHELLHIHNHDYVYRLLGILVITLHWFNPFAYLLFNQLVIFSEFTCDESIVKDLNKQQQIEYGCLILGFSENISHKTLYTPMSLLGSYSKKVMKERIIRMKSFKAKKNFRKFIEGIIFISTFIISSLTVLAYNEPLVLDEKEKYVNYEDVEVSAHYISLEPDEELTKLPNLDKIEGLTYYFIDKENRVFKIEKATEKSICEHSYEKGSYVKHFLYSDNSCKEEYYNAKKCKRCNDIVLGTKYNTITYEKCFH